MFLAFWIILVFLEFSIVVKFVKIIWVAAARIRKLTYLRMIINNF